MLPLNIVIIDTPRQFPHDARCGGDPVESAAVSGEQIVVTRMNGEPLPEWVTYNKASNTFTVNASGKGSLPLEVKLMVGAEQVVLTITERND